PRRALAREPDAPARPERARPPRGRGGARRRRALGDGPGAGPVPRSRARVRSHPRPRFCFGLVASAVAVAVMDAHWYAGVHASGWILSLALVTGLFSLALYYYGLRTTPAVLSSLAELTNPAVLVVAGIYAYNAHLLWSQWLGFAIIVAVVTLLPVQRRREVVRVPAADAALATG